LAASIETSDAEEARHAYHNQNEGRHPIDGVNDAHVSDARVGWGLQINPFEIHSHLWVILIRQSTKVDSTQNSTVSDRVAQSGPEKRRSVQPGAMMQSSSLIVRGALCEGLFARRRIGLRTCRATERVATKSHKLEPPPATPAPMERPNACETRRSDAHTYRLGRIAKVWPQQLPRGLAHEDGEFGGVGYGMRALVK